ncbi:RES domain protein (plasmid) [Deinococcus proteolyticus MRP]|uniref:RES domain protein n=2 Tax=Deinococcus TaxID=1298 RepID=F0RQH9_DEIPM|nr:MULTISPECIES: RES family NAD+ phosphorylase [Deinococcus]ADY27538.1 RES domain protein [Deinococcus proteolyticus MRP]MCY1704374.1 RES family NAD+ phosphorylase [Deinococcus sp. SL84]RTR21865.1 RES domain-containing protein [Deinococcus radiophilus]UFA52028.1 RES family NAD+ phosphorylase [Deinococcus radiophilus]
MSIRHFTGRPSRLIPSCYDPPILREHAQTPEEYDALLDLDNLTNGRVMAGKGETSEPYQSVRQACFHYASNSRFNIPLEGHGAWYAAELKTAQHEVGYHFALRAIAEGLEEFSTDYTRYSSYVDDDLVEAESLPEYVQALQVDPNDYTVSQRLGERLREQGCAGICYQSQRSAGDSCIALLQEWAVTHIQRHEGYRFSWNPVTEEVEIRRK